MTEKARADDSSLTWTFRWISFVALSAAALGCDGGAKTAGRAPESSASHPEEREAALVDGSSGPTTPSVGGGPVTSVVVVSGVLGTHRLGNTLFVSYVTGDERNSTAHEARVTDTGLLIEVAADMPATTWIHSDSGSYLDVPVALLGAPEGPTWMWTRGSRMLRTEQGRWRCVGRCGEAHTGFPEPWQSVLERPVQIDGETRVMQLLGDVVDDRSRGHLFGLQRQHNPSDVSYYVLPRALGGPEIVRKIRPLKDTSPLELADGSIVDLDAVFTSTMRSEPLLHADGTSPRDLWKIDAEGLAEVHGTARSRAPLPTGVRPRDVDGLVVEITSPGAANIPKAIWISSGNMVFRRDPTGGPWTPSRVAEAGESVSIAAASSNALYVVVRRPDRLPVTERDSRHALFERLTELRRVSPSALWV